MNQKEVIKKTCSHGALLDAIIMPISFVWGFVAAYRGDLSMAIFWGLVFCGETIAISVDIIWRVMLVHENEKEKD